MSIQEHLNKIRNAIKGSEVRESIAKGIETAYDDASENGNANMEVKIARGTHPNLRSRLEEVDDKQQQTTAQLAQTDGRISTIIAEAGDGSLPSELVDMRVVNHKTYSVAGDALRALSKGEALENNSVSVNHFSFVRETDSNLFTGEYMARHLTGNVNGGALAATNSAARSFICKIEPNTKYYVSKEPSDRFRIALFNALPNVGDATARYVKDESMGDESTQTYHTFTTSDTEQYVVVVVSMAEKEPRLYLGDVKYSITEKEKRISGDVFKQGKNLFDGIYYDGAITGSEGGNGRIFRDLPGKHGVVEIEPNTTYTFSKTPSNITKIGISDEYPTTNKSNIRVIKDSQSGEVDLFTFTTGATDAYLTMELARDGDLPAFVQVEKGASMTSRETYGYSLEPFAQEVETETTLFDFGAVGDGVTDDTEAIQRALDSGAGGKIIIPNHTFLVSGTLYVRSGTTLEGFGDHSQIVLGDVFLLDSFMWRDSPLTNSIIRTAEGSKDIKFKNFRITGSNTFKLHRQQGLAIVDTENVLLEDMTVEKINFFPAEARQTGTSLAYCVGVLRSKNVRVVRGRFEYGGYETFGTEDSENITIDDSFFGVGWRTSLQFHRGTKNVKVNGITIDQNHPDAHSALTLHGRVGQEVEDISIHAMTLHSITDATQVRRGGVQLVEGAERNVRISDSVIVSNNVPLHIGASGLPNQDIFVDKWKITNCDIVGEKGIFLEVQNSHFKDNTIDTVDAAIVANGDKYIIKDNILVNNSTINTTGTSFTEEGNI